MLARNGDHGLDGSDVVHGFEVGVFLFLRDLVRVNGKPLLLAQHLQDVTRGHATQRVESILGEMDSMPCSHLIPSAPVQRHGVSEGPVAIENKSTDSHWSRDQ